MEAARQATRIGDQMLVHVGQGRQPRLPVDLVRAAREAADRALDAVPNGVAIRYDLPGTTCMVDADLRQLREAITGLVVNALEASRLPGAVAIAVRETSAATIDASAGPDPRWLPTAGRYLTVEIRDDGAGMDAATLRAAFDPFFSTHAVGRGLGLPLALGVARALDGTVTVASGPGKGTTVALHLPAADS